MVTGGVNLENVAQYLAAGVAAVGVGEIILEREAIAGRKCRRIDRQCPSLCGRNQGRAVKGVKSKVCIWESLSRSYRRRSLPSFSFFN